MKTKNETIKEIIAFINANDGFTIRINTQLKYDSKKDVWRKSHQQNNTPDIIACIDGNFLAIKICKGNSQQIEKAGGKYISVESLEEFMQKISE